MMRGGLILRRVPVYVILLPSLALAASVSAQGTNWKCSDPHVPFRFADSEESRDAQTPEPCKNWLEIRGENLAELVEIVSGDRFEAANLFLDVAAGAGDFEYPELDRAPVTTRLLYDDPAEFGFDVVLPDDAPTGSLVVYDGLGGILVEMRDPETGEWRKQVLYPSAAHDFDLAVAELSIPGKLDPRVLRPMGPGGVS